VKKERRFPHLNMRVRFILLIMIEFFVVTILSWGIPMIINHLFHITLNISFMVWVLLLSTVISGAIISYMSRRIFDPITRLENAMKQVADGDFKIRLNADCQVDEIRSIYHSFNRMAEELSATEMLQMDFVSNVSHEIKTPVNAIEGYATLLQGESIAASEECIQYIDKILFNTRRLSTLVGNILLLSKVDNQAIQSRQDEFRLDEQIRQAIVLLESLWTEKEIEFDVELDEMLYYGSQNLLLHVWSNLLSNAIKFSPPEGLIRIRLRQKEQTICFYIEDCGPGFEESIKNHLFDKFYQGDTSHKQEGNGLGLALVKKILLLCGGSIEAENLPVCGCRFTVTLPFSKHP